MSKTLKFGIILLALLCVALGVILFVEMPNKETASGSPISTEIPNDAVQGDEGLTQAIQAALADRQGRWQEFNYQIDHIQVQDDGRMAVVWLAAIDPESGEFLGREPELALAEKSVLGQWQILLEDDTDFDETFKTFQYAGKNILNGDILSGDQAALPKTGKVYGGYYLPWAAGLEKRLTWSVGHSSCYPIYYCTHAFDFADGTMFPIVAAKGGTVFHWRDTCANGDTYCTNSITIQDKSTTPWTYQIYLHIAQGSVAANLKKVGTPVLQGQYIANVDDTGYSSGHHVHFMVVTEDTRYFSSSMQSVWGVAEDITFRDVDINWDPVTQGGRPRLEYEAATYGGEGRTYYTSGNLPANAPTGGLNQPATKTYLTNKIMTVSGWAKDDVSVTKAEIMANYADNWITIGEAAGGSTFTTDIDLCETPIPDGHFQLAVRVWDYEGNPSAIVGIRDLVKNVECGAAGSDPVVRIESIALPQNGEVIASADMGGSSSRTIASVEFWFHGRDWNKDKWVYLGKDSNGDNGWTAPLSTEGLAQASNYTLLAVVTDADDKQGADVKFNAIVDSTNPWVKLNTVSSPIEGESVTLTWSGGDDLSGLDHYLLAVKVGDDGYQVLEDNLPATTKSYDVNINPAEIMIPALTAYDKSGNEITQKIAMYSEGYVFPYQYIFPVFYSSN